MLDRLPEGTSIVVGRNPDAFDGRAAEADVVVNWSAPKGLLRTIWPHATRIKWVHSKSAGLDTFLFPELIESPVPLTNGRGVFSESLGEFVLASALFFAKDFRRMLRQQTEGRWEQFDIEEISRQTMGIIGYGDIGKACAKRAKAMGMRVLAVRRRPELSKDDKNVDEVHSLDEMFSVIAQSDYVVATAPLTPATRSLLGAKAIAVMKPTAVIMNVGRGPVIDEKTLIEALQHKSIRGAALDVFDTEPLPAGHPFFSMDNVLISPHCADHTSDWSEQAMLLFLENFARYRAGQPLINVVDKSNGY
jgi:phosphoglycerate dehydrogenase-like enzyme